MTDVDIECAETADLAVSMNFTVTVTCKSRHIHLEE